VIDPVVLLDVGLGINLTGLVGMKREDRDGLLAAR